MFCIEKVVPGVTPPFRVSNTPCGTRKQTLHCKRQEINQHKCASFHNVWLGNLGSRNPIHLIPCLQPLNYLCPFFTPFLSMDLSVCLSFTISPLPYTYIHTDTDFDNFSLFHTSFRLAPFHQFFLISSPFIAYLHPHSSCSFLIAWLYPGCFILSISN